jgi:hypothetical protein
MVRRQAMHAELTLRGDTNVGAGNGADGPAPRNNRRRRLYLLTENADGGCQGRKARRRAQGTSARYGATARDASSRGLRMVATHWQNPHLRKCNRK